VSKKAGRADKTGARPCSIVGRSSGGKNRAVTSILNGGTNHALDSSEVDGGGFHAEKKESVSKLGHALLSIKGENMHPVTWVTIEVVCNGEWSIGGRP
jgi:hypothetical protein